MLNLKKWMTKVSEEIETLQGTSVETFTPTFSLSITDINVRSTNCWYNPKSGIAHVAFLILSPSGLIPVNNAVIATVPGKYKPKAFEATYALVCPNKYQPPNFEAASLNMNGQVSLGNFIYGATTTYAIAFETTYYVGN